MIFKGEKYARYPTNARYFKKSITEVSQKIQKHITKRIHQCKEQMLNHRTLTTSMQICKSASAFINLSLCIMLSFVNVASSESFDQRAAIRNFGLKHFFSSSFFGFGHLPLISIAFTLTVNSFSSATIPRRCSSSIASFQ